LYICTSVFALLNFYFSVYFVDHWLSFDHFILSFELRTYNYTLWYLQTFLDRNAADIFLPWRWTIIDSQWQTCNFILFSIQYLTPYIL
jgi:hypothetical protein